MFSIRPCTQQKWALLLRMVEAGRPARPDSALLCSLFSISPQPGVKNSPHPLLVGISSFGSVLIYRHRALRPSG